MILMCVSYSQLACEYEKRQLDSIIQSHKINYRINDSIIYFTDTNTNCKGLVYFDKSKELLIYGVETLKKFPDKCAGSMLWDSNYTFLDLILLSDTIINESYLIRLSNQKFPWESLDIAGILKINEAYYYSVFKPDNGELHYTYNSAYGSALENTDYPPYDMRGWALFTEKMFDTNTIYKIDKVPYFVARSSSIYPYGSSCIYIDSSYNKPLYSALRFYNSDEDGETYRSMMNDIVDKKKYKLNKKFLAQLPNEMVELRLYKDNWYLYAPSDWGTLGKASITDSTFVDYNMDGPWPKLIKKIKTLDQNIYLLELTGQGFSEDMVLHLIDPEKGLVLFGHLDNKQIVYDCLMCNSNKMNNYPCIVNYSPKMKVQEFRFDIPDYQQLIFQYKK